MIKGNRILQVKHASTDYREKYSFRSVQIAKGCSTYSARISGRASMHQGSEFRRSHLPWPRVGFTRILVIISPSRWRRRSMMLNICRSTGHVLSFFDHSWRQVAQNVWSQVSGVPTSCVVNVAEQTGHFTLLSSADECPAICSPSLALWCLSSSWPLLSLLYTLCTAGWSPSAPLGFTSALWNAFLSFLAGSITLSSLFRRQADSSLFPLLVSLLIVWCNTVIYFIVLKNPL
jgi:hypothetical protein